MSKVYNFSAGPAMLPEAVMQQAQQEFLNWNNQGCSVMEMSHRSAEYIELAAQAEADLRDLMSIPKHYKVLFLQGGGRGHFASVPLNIASSEHTADYAISGSWSKSAATEGQKYLNVNAYNVIDESKNLLSVKPFDEWQQTEGAAYLHFCPNETVDGIAISGVPKSQLPIVADLSSTILSEKINVNDYGVIYAGAQKNIGPSGISIVIVDEKLLGNAREETPSIFDYTLQTEKESMFNTPPTFAWYLAGLVFKWLKQQGGIDAIAKVNQQKANLLYNFIDNSDFYQSRIAAANRSKMNVPFYLTDESLNSRFLEESVSAGLKALKGHRSVGGMRASIYNAMPLEGVETLVNFMDDFAKKHQA